MEVLWGKLLLSVHDLYWNYIGCIFVIQVGTNRTFYFHGAKKATPIVDFVIVDILEGLSVPGISKPMSSIPFWNAKFDKKKFVFFKFYMQYLHNDGVLWIFYPEDLKWTKELSKYFFSYISRLFMNLRLVWIHFVSPIIAIQTKQLVSQVIFIIFSFILINHICVYYSLIVLLFRLFYICCEDHQVHCNLTCSIF